MKAIDQAIDLLKSSSGNIGESAKVLRLLESAKTKSENLEAALLASTDYLGTKIRYTDWPSIGLGLDLQAEEMDEILIESERCLNAAKRKVKV